MELTTKPCRCCGATCFQRLPVLAEVDPFFARHGLQIEVSQSVVVPLLDWGLRNKLNRLPPGLASPLHRFLDRLRSRNLLESRRIALPYGLCEHCHFLAPWMEIGDDQLQDYYAHYLQEQYKQARTVFQPDFAQLGQVMGSPAEGESRRHQHEAYIFPHLQKLREQSCSPLLRVLDYGGGAGHLLPQADWLAGSVLEVEGNTSSNGGEEHQGYDLVQCLHVLEHVGHPLATCRRLASHGRQGGLIYLEVPIEFPGLAAIAAGKLPICHEHINKFPIEAIRALLLAAQLEPIEVIEAEVDFLHLSGLTPVVRALARKP
jgi:hypothetical protein